MSVAPGHRLTTALYWLLLVSPGLIPLLAPYLPFQDWPGHVAITAAKHWLDQGIALPEAYASRGWIGPNRLPYALTGLLVGLVGPLWASNLVLAAGMAALGPAAHVAIRALGGDVRWAPAVLALALGRVIACGFGPNFLALPAALLAVAAYWKLAARPARIAALAGALAVVMGMHLFVFLAVVGLLAASALLDLLRRDTRVRGALALAVAAVMVGVMRAVAFLPDGGGQGSVFDAVWSALRTPDPSALANTLWQWNFAFFRVSKLDDATQAVWAAGLLLGLGLAVARGRATPVPRLLVLVLLALIAFAWLPETIGPPVNWWGGNLRIPTLISLLIVLAAAQSQGRVASVACGLAIAGSGAYLLIAGAQVVRFSRDEMGGLARLLHHVPPQTKVCTMHYTTRETHEFPGEPHWYAGGYAMAAQPVAIEHSLLGDRGVLVSRPREIPGPGHAVGSGFSWSQHHSWCDSFLVRYQLHDPGQPFSGQAQECVELVEEQPPWRYYRRSAVTTGRCARRP